MIPNTFNAKLDGDPSLPPSIHPSIHPSPITPSQDCGLSWSQLHVFLQACCCTETLLITSCMAQPEAWSTLVLILISDISVLSPLQSCSELIIAPPPPWPFSCSESATPQQPSTFVVAAFITPKQPNEQLDSGLKKPTGETGRHLSPVQAETPPLAQPEPDFQQSFHEKPPSGGLFLEGDDSKTDTIKRCPAK